MACIRGVKSHLKFQKSLLGEACPRAVFAASPGFPVSSQPCPLLPGLVLAPQAQPQALLLREALPEGAQPSDRPGPGTRNLGGAGPPSDLLGQVS